MLELVFSVVMLLLCLAVFIEAGNYPSFPVSKGGGASFYPRFLVALLFILIVIYIIQNRHKIISDLKDKNKRPSKETMQRYFLWAMFALILILIPILLPWLGFIATGALSIFASSMVIRVKEKKADTKGTVISAAMAVAVSLIIYLVFVKVFIIPLPTGKLF